MASGAVACAGPMQAVRGGAVRMPISSAFPADTDRVYRVPPCAKRRTPPGALSLDRKSVV